MFIKESKSGDSNLFEIYLYSFSAAVSWGSAALCHMRWKSEWSLSSNISFIFWGRRGVGSRGAFWIIKQYTCRKEYCWHGGTRFKCLWVPFDYISFALNLLVKYLCCCKLAHSALFPPPPLQPLCPHPTPAPAKRQLAWRLVNLLLRKMQFWNFIRLMKKSLGNAFVLLLFADCWMQFRLG